MRFFSSLVLRSETLGGVAGFMAVKRKFGLVDVSALPGDASLGQSAHKLRAGAEDREAEGRKCQSNYGWIPCS